MDTAKEAVHKVTHPTTAAGGNGGSTQDKPGLERDMKPKPTKVHLEYEAEGQTTYIPCGKLKEGAKVAVVYLPSEEDDAQHTKAQVEKNGGEILLIASDLSRALNCKNVAERTRSAFGRVDILVNNAATEPCFSRLMKKLIAGSRGEPCTCKLAVFSASPIVEAMPP